MYTFTLPPSWTGGTIGVVGRLLPARAPPPPVARASVVGRPPVVAPCQTQTCLNNDTMTLSHIPFYASRGVEIDPVQMEASGAPMPDPSKVFQWAKLVTPIPVTVKPYQGTIDITDLAQKFHQCLSTGTKYITCSDNANDAGSSRLDDWVCDHGSPEHGWDIGVARGLTNYNDICWGQFAI